MGTKSLDYVIIACLRKALARGTWVIFPIKGTVGGPGGKLRGRQLARKYLDKTVTTRAMRRHNRPTPERLVVPTKAIWV